jgi:hypothetical protein
MVGQGESLFALLQPQYSSTKKKFGLILCNKSMLTGSRYQAHSEMRR